jgi:hypothetical protein
METAHDTFTIVSDFGPLAKGNLALSQRKCVTRAEESGCARCNQGASRWVRCMRRVALVDEMA